VRISAGMVGILLNSYTPRASSTVQTNDDMAASGLLTEGRVLRRGQRRQVTNPRPLSTSAREERQPVRVQSWLRSKKSLAAFEGGSRRARRFAAKKVLAIFSRAHPIDITKGLCKVLLCLETTSHGHGQYPHIGST